MKTKQGEIALLYCSASTLAVAKGPTASTDMKQAVTRGDWSFTDGSLETALRSFSAAQGLEKPSIYLMLPRHEVTVRTFTLPSQDRDEILNMIRLNADAHVPYALEELVTDALLLKSLPSGESRVLGVYAHKATLDPYLKLLSAAGLEVEGILLSTAGFCGLTAKDGLVVDCGFDGVEITVLEAGKPVFSRGVAVAQSWDTIGQDNPQGHEAREELVLEVRNSIAAFNRDSDQELPLTGLACGGAIENPDNLDTALRASLNMECTPMSSSGLPMAMTGLLQVLIAGDTPVNLLPQDLQQQRIQQHQQRATIKAALLALALILALGGLFVQARGQRTQRIQELNQALEQLEPQVRGVASQREQLMILESEVNREGNALETLAAIAHVAPGEGLNINRYLYERETGVKLWGKAMSLDLINQFRTAIREYGTDSLDLLKNAQSMYERQTLEWGTQVYMYHLAIPQSEEAENE